MPQDFLKITVGLWIQNKLLGSASFVLGSIGMFLGVPAINFESYSGTSRMPRRGTTDHGCLSWPLRQLPKRAQVLVSDQTSNFSINMLEPWQVLDRGFTWVSKTRWSILGVASTIRDINEAYTRSGEMICRTHIVYLGFPEYDEVAFLLPFRAKSCI